MVMVFLTLQRYLSSQQIQVVADWDELPKFFDVFNENKINGNEVVRGSIKLLFLTLLRVESCVGMRFEEVDDEEIRFSDAEEKYRIFVLIALGLIFVEFISRKLIFKSIV